MDWINEIRTGVTLFAFLSFLGICFWAYSRHTQQEFDEAAQIPFREKEAPILDQSDPNWRG